MFGSWKRLYTGFDRSIRTLKARQAFEQLKEANPALGRFDEPGAVVGYLANRDGDLDEKDRILRELVTLVQRREHPELAATLLWLGLWPGLDARYRRFPKRFRHQLDELVGVFSDAFLSAVAALKLQRVNKVAATLVANTERRVMDGCKRRWDEEKRRVDADPLEPVGPVDKGPAAASLVDLAARQERTDAPPQTSLGLASPLAFDEEEDRLRGWLVPLVGEDTELVLGVHMRNESQHEAGARLGVTEEAARKRVQRAVARLQKYVATKPCPSLAKRTAFVLS